MCKREVHAKIPSFVTGLQPSSVMNDHVNEMFPKLCRSQAV